jgi:hypothetical protein
VPLVVPELNVTVDPLEKLHVGGSISPPFASPDSVQLRVTVPAYPFDAVTVTVEVADPPGEEMVAAVAANVNTDAVTVTAAEAPVADE